MGKPSVDQPLGASLLFWLATSSKIWTGSGLSGKVLNLAAPHRAAGFRVRLDFHWIAPFFVIFCLPDRSKLGSELLGSL